MTHTPLAPIRHPNKDFFVCDVFDVLPFIKDDQASMEHPVFSLSTKPDMRVLHYEHNGNTLTVKPGMDGLATIHDKDILLYCASYLRAAIADGHEPNQVIRFTGYDYLISTNRLTNGAYYDRFKASLERLAGTRLQTNIKTGGYSIESGFGLIDRWHAVKEDEDGRVIAVEVKLSDWTYNAIMSNELLTINRDYFRLRKPLERRIYEIARKHCGDQDSFKIGLDKLHKKIGSTAPVRKLRAQIRAMEKTDHLPDYSLSMQDDLITFENRKKAISKQVKANNFLSPSTIERAKQAAPRLDIYAAKEEFDDWTEGKETPRNRTAAFIGFCKKKAKQLGLS